MAALQSMEEYGVPFQMKVISSLLTHKEFLQNINDVLSDEHFSNPSHKWIVNEILQYFQKYHTSVVRLHYNLKPKTYNLQPITYNL